MAEQSVGDLWLDMLRGAKNNMAVQRTGEGERVDTRQRLVDALRATLDEYPGAAGPIGVLRGAGLELPLAGFQGIAALSGNDEAVSDLSSARRELGAIFDEATEGNADPGVGMTGDIMSLIGAGGPVAAPVMRAIPYGTKSLGMIGQGAAGGAAAGATLGSDEAETAREDIAGRVLHGGAGAALGAGTGLAGEVLAPMLPRVTRNAILNRLKGHRENNDDLVSSMRAEQIARGDRLPDGRIVVRNPSAVKSGTFDESRYYISDDVREAARKFQPEPPRVLQEEALMGARGIGYPKGVAKAGPSTRDIKPNRMEGMSKRQQLDYEQQLADDLVHGKAPDDPNITFIREGDAGDAWVKGADGRWRFFEFMEEIGPDGLPTGEVF